MKVLMRHLHFVVLCLDVGKRCCHESADAAFAFRRVVFARHASALSHLYSVITCYVDWRSEAASVKSIFQECGWCT